MCPVSVGKRKGTQGWQAGGGRTQQRHKWIIILVFVTKYFSVLIMITSIGSPLTLFQARF